MSCSGSPPTRSPRNGRSMTAYGTAADVDDRRGDRFVHRHGAVAEAADARTIAQCLRERGPEDERDVLDGVVLVDLEVAVGLDREIEQPVVRERAQEVVVEPDPGVDGGVAGAVEPERHRDVGLARGPRDGHAPLLARADGQFAERGGHAGDSVVLGAAAPAVAGAAISLAALMSRSFSSGSRTVSRRRAGQDVPGRERARHEAAGQERLGDGARLARASRSRRG